MIESEWRKSQDLYDIQYEQIPHFCFSCGSLGNSDLVCPTPGTRDENGDLPFSTSLRATEDRKPAGSSDGPFKEPQNSTSNKKDASSSSNRPTTNAEVTSPVKKRVNPKRKGGTSDKESLS